MACSEEPIVVRCTHCEFVHQSTLKPDSCHICGGEL